MRLYIKNMVCQHCIEAVLKVFREMGIEVASIRLGEVEISADEGRLDKDQLKALLERNGFELLENKEVRIVEQIKTTVINMIHHGDKMPEVKNSVYLSEKLGLTYPYLSKLFSRHVGLTIEKYIILQKIERVKELLSYDEQQLSEIAFDLGYSSVQHLSNQFKSVTGMSVTAFKKLEHKARIPLNRL
ncbi:MAG: AraC family transcriptional regulator [Bacteroidota bacterium]